MTEKILQNKTILNIISASFLAIFSIIIGFYYKNQFPDISGDAEGFLALIKNVINGEFIYSSKLMGFPRGFNSAELPDTIASLSQWIIVWVLTFFSNSATSIYQAYYILSFGMASLSMFIILRKLGVAIAISFGLGFLYSFIPYHYMRFGHFDLFNYANLPVLSYILILLFQNKIKFFGILNGKTKLLLNKSNLGLLLIFAICIAWYSYNAWFTALFFCAVFVMNFFRLSEFSSIEEKRNLILTPIFLIFLYIIIEILLVLPVLYYGVFPGGGRGFVETEQYALRIMQLFLPISDHLIPSIAKLNIKYANGTAFALYENVSSSLGILLSITLLSSMFYFLFSSLSGNVKKTNNKAIIFFLSGICILAILYGTFGGFSTFIAFFLKITSFRGINRISIYIATFLIIILALFLQDRKKKGFIFWLIFTVVCILSFFDTAGKRNIPWKNPQIEEITNFTKQINTVSTKGDAILILPIIPFYGTGIHPLSAPYIFSERSMKLKFSHGIMKPESSILANLTIINTNEKIKALNAIGFKSIIIDTTNFKDVEAIKLLEAQSKEQTIESSSGRFKFIKINDEFETGFRIHSTFSNYIDSITILDAELAKQNILPILNALNIPENCKTLILDEFEKGKNEFQLKCRKPIYNNNFNKYPFLKFKEFLNFQNNEISTTVNKTPNGVITYGPYLDLEKGEYKITLTYKINKLAKDGKSPLSLVVNALKPSKDEQYNLVPTFEIFPNEIGKIENKEIEIQSKKKIEQLDIVTFLTDNSGSFTLYSLTIEKL